MKRNLSDFVKKEYDLLVVGGGIYGATVCWEATLRGLSVALVEKTDFGGATSASSLKVIHGGLRYLQHADFKRARESIGERKTLLKIAPHLIHVLPVLMPTYGHGMKGREIMAAGLLLNDIVGFDRNRSLDPQKQIPGGRTISKKDVLKILPGVAQDKLTGAALFYDALAYNSERLTLSYVHSAAKLGADVANYAEIIEFIGTDKRVQGAVVKDSLTGEQHEVRARMVVNTAGPWTPALWRLLHKERPSPPPLKFAKSFNIITRQLFDKYAVAISSSREFTDNDAVVQRGSRMLFVVPWRGKSMIGTEYIPCSDDPDSFKVTPEELQTFIDDLNSAYPEAKLTLDDILHVHEGMVPIKGVDPKTGSVRLGKQYEIRDHRQDGVEGVVSVLGVKYTTARFVAEEILDHVYAAWGEASPPSTSAVTLLHDGQIERFDVFLEMVGGEKRPFSIPPNVLHQLVCNYGSAYQNVLSYVDIDALDESDINIAITKAETRYAVREEMAQTLTDILFRRTELGSAGYPGDGVLQACADVMATELGWSFNRKETEIHQTKIQFYATTSDKIHGTTLASSTI
ncbi:MAG: glycerol-3-phosphate dehydrogenase/oxidase [Chloroflexi bacterium]|nr:MAG: glycerol-3-phosphate dehydrogenase/oxidase [Chloroflexota bacterium]